MTREEAENKVSELYCAGWVDGSNDCDESKKTKKLKLEIIKALSDQSELILATDHNTSTPQPLLSFEALKQAIHICWDCGIQEDSKELKCDAEHCEAFKLLTKKQNNKD